MQQYHSLAKEILSRGDVQFEPRTEEYIIGISAFLNVHNVREGFPIVTTKEVNPRQPFEELFWKLRGERNVKSLVDRKVNIWTPNAFDRYLKQNNLKEKFPKHSVEWNEEFKSYSEKIKNNLEFASIAGDLGPVYGYQWRHWTGSNGKQTDQLTKLLNGIKERPGSRYHILNAWNVGDLGDMAIGPCPYWHQFSVFGDKLDLTMVQRSCDTYLGVPFNEAQDSLLLHMVAKETGLTPRFFNHSFINTHFYLGVPPRANFWLDKENVKEFQGKFKDITQREDYLQLREWYLSKTSPERVGTERKDHIPSILEQLSKTPQPLPTIKLKYDIPLLEVINRNVNDVIEVTGYTPAKWDSKASMAA